MDTFEVSNQFSFFIETPIVNLQVEESCDGSMKDIYGQRKVF